MREHRDSATRARHRPDRGLDRGAFLADAGRNRVPRTREPRQTCHDEPVSAEDTDSDTTDGGSRDDDRRDRVDGTTAVEYDCSPWAGETRRILRSVLSDRDIPHAWEGTVVVVPAEFEDDMDVLIDEVASTARPSLGTARATVAYEVSAWSAATQNTLIEGLIDRTVPHQWDADGDLVVHEEDAEVLEELIGALGDPDGGQEIDGIELHDRLGRLFVAADRLAADPSDPRGTRDIATAYRTIETAAVPFGVEAERWLELHRIAAALLDTVGRVAAGDADAYAFDQEDDDLDRDDDPGDTGAESGVDPSAPVFPSSVEALARLLRDLLRRFV